MSQILVFMLPDHLFELLREEVGGRFAFELFDPAAGGLQYIAPPAKADPGANYVRGGYRAAYLSTGGLPKGSRDYDFLDRESEQLIEVRGARSNKKRLELATIRVVSKKSKLKKQFAAFKKRLTTTCNAGVKLDGHPYPDILWEPDVEQLELTTDWESPSGKVEVMSTPVKAKPKPKPKS